jgi:glucans biosynthesis protein
MLAAAAPLLRVLGLSFAILGLAAPPARAFDLEDVARTAAAIAREPYRERAHAVPKWLLVGSLTYDQWRDIRFRPDHALWRAEGLPFQVQLFHPGLYFDRAVRVNVVDGRGAHEVPYSPELFDLGKNRFGPRVPRDLGFAGLRIHAPLKTPAYFDEVAVFLGASYFRALGRDNVYGQSARGLAVDTAEPRGEEFPRFIEFWLVKPAPDAKSLTLYALLDGPSASGAYRFEVTPGVQTRMAVDARLYVRRAGAKLGIAPLTSMFFFGENGPRGLEDFRPEVHDSDGLQLHLGSGEWLWRPLDNPARLDLASFQTSGLRGFGLVQRDLAFASYQDLETREELRPSTWVEPRGDWGAGHVELVEIPTATELVDNIVAYWVPAAPVRAGDALSFSYGLSWGSADAIRPPAGRAVATRRDRGSVHSDHEGYRYIVDFEGGALGALPAEPPPKAIVDASRGVVPYDVTVYKNAVTGGFRLAFQIKPAGVAPVELRAFLKKGEDVLTETWSSVWHPPAPPPALPAKP